MKLMSNSSLMKFNNLKQKMGVKKSNTENLDELYYENILCDDSPEKEKQMK